MSTPNDDTSIQISSIAKWKPPEGQTGRGMLMRTNRGDVEALVHHGTETDKAIVWVWGARGGFDGPANGLYGNLAEELKGQYTSLRVNYRNPSVLGESVLDTMAGISFLTGTGHNQIILVGHSFGGAVVITTASLGDERIKAVVALSSQTYGAQSAGSVSPRPLLLVHGEDDTRLPVSCSEMIYQWAAEPKELVTYPGAEHGLRECEDEVHELVRNWIVTQFSE